MWSVNRRTCGWLCVFGSLAVSAAIALHVDGAIGEEPKAAPPIAKASAEEIEILERHVELLVKVFNKIEALHLHSVRGGESDKVELAATKLAVARAELAAARGDLKNAVTHQQDATQHSDKYVECATAVFEAGSFTLCDLLEAHELRRDCSLKRIKLQQTVNAK